MDIDGIFSGYVSIEVDLVTMEEGYLVKSYLLLNGLGYMHIIIIGKWWHQDTQ